MSSFLMGLRVLWVRHTPVVAGRVTRDMHLLPRLGRRHDVHVVTWRDRATTQGRPWMRLVPERGSESGIPVWTLPTLPRPPGWKPWWRSVNEPMFRGALRWLERHTSADVVVVGPSWFFIGLPPPLRAARVFDYLDGTDWRWPHWRHAEIDYLDWCDGVVCVSDVLAQRVQPWQRPCLVAPNGVELERLLGRRQVRGAVRRDLGVEGRKVVSLVGLTAAEDRYWEDAIRRMAERVADFLFVAVGDGPLAPVMQRLASELGDRFRWEGAVPYERALDWFTASDVTWYPGADNEYFHAASPLKVFEGLAAGAQVVVAPGLRALASVSLPSLHVAAPTSEGLARATEDALEARSPDLEAIRAALAGHSWDSIAEQVSDFLEQVASDVRAGARRRTHPTSR